MPRRNRRRRVRRLRIGLVRTLLRTAHVDQVAAGPPRSAARTAGGLAGLHGTVTKRTRRYGIAPRPA